MEKNIIDKLIEILSELEIGEYDNNKGIKLNVIETERDILAEFKCNNEFKFSSNGMKTDIYIPLDDNSYFYYGVDNFSEKKYNYIYVDKNNKRYTVYNNGITVTDLPFLKVIENKLLYKISNNIYLEYNFNDNKINVYYRKYDSKAGNDLNKEFVKFRYHNFFTSGIKSYNFKLANLINGVKGEFKTSIYEELVNSLTVPELECKNISEEVTTLKSLADVYATYRDKFDLKQYESELNEIYNFVVSLINEPVQANINNVRYMIQNIDFNDKESLIKLRTELDKVIEPDKKNKKLRKKK